ncbi:J domain-containing protein [Wenyingzhuangia sp. IMCC45533]
MHQIEKYYVLLGVDSDSSLNDIKKAYRRKAKQCHPDKNKNENAEQLFIALSEAYQYLCQYKNDEIPVYETVDREFYDAREKAREQARAHARMRYEEFLNSDFYKNDQAFVILLNHLQFFLSVILITAPIILTSHYVFNQKLIGVILSLAAAFFWQRNYRKHVDLDLEVLKEALQTILKIKASQYVISIIINLYLFVKYTLNTELNNFVSASIFIITNIFLYLILYFYKRIKHKWYLLSIPLAINFIFFINYHFSSSATEETYSFKHQYSSFGNNAQKTSSIILENNSYHKVSSFRMFTSFEKMKNKHYVCYSFEQGLFGLKVLKSYHFF